MVKIGIVVQKKHPNDKEQQHPNVFIANKLE
jgi:hypothetical protein